jgi:methionyl-tRNA formyltransferase
MTDSDQNIPKNQAAKIRIIFMGTPDFAVASLLALAHDARFEIAAVVTQPDRASGRKLLLKPSPVKEAALKLGLTVHSPQTVNTEEFRQMMRGLQVETGVVVAFGQILGQKFLEIFPRGLVNVHGSLLPKWRGAAPIQRSIIAGDPDVGISLQIIVKELDAGPLLGMRSMRLEDDMNCLRVYELLKQLGAEMLRDEYIKYLQGDLLPQPQAIEGLSFAHKIDKLEAHITEAVWQKPAREIFNLIRGLSMGPQPWVSRAGKMLKLLGVKPLDGPSNGRPGEVVEVGDDFFRVACGVGSLSVYEVQPESRSRMSARDYIKGYQMQKSEVLL